MNVSTADVSADSRRNDNSSNEYGTTDDISPTSTASPATPQ